MRAGAARSSICPGAERGDDGDAGVSAPLALSPSARALGSARAPQHSLYSCRAGLVRARRGAGRLPAVPGSVGECAKGMTTPLTVEQLRSKHPRFIYHSFAVERLGEAVKLCFHFTIEPDIRFAPETIIETGGRDRISTLSPGT